MLSRILATTTWLALAASPAAAAPGAVYALTNSPAGNAVVAYARAGDGSLSPLGTFATGGAGTGAGLGSQGAVIVSDDHQLLFAVDAGSDEISAFRVRPDGLELADRAASGGDMPTSLAYSRGLLYVLNAGGAGNVSGFTVDRFGHLAAIAGSARPLSAAGVAPAQVGFSDGGAVLIVSERASNRLTTYTVGADGLLSYPIAHASAGPVPFGFAVNKRDVLLVSEAGPGGGASTYAISEDGGLAAASSMIVTGQRAACWAVATKNGRYGYVTNAGTGNISGFAIAQDGTASLLDADGVTAVTGGNPTDAAVSHDSQYLYARVAATRQIAIFRIRSDGSLTAMPALSNTPAGLAGLAGY